MITISVQTRGLDLFPGRPEVRAAIEQALRRSQAAIVTAATRNLSGRIVRVRTGKLRRGMRSSLKVVGDRFVATVRNVTFYGHILESGAKAHRVPKLLGRRALRNRLRRGEGPQKTLRFEVGGRVVFARSVVIPPLRPRRWFAAAVDEALPELQRAFEQELGSLSSVIRGRIAS